MSRSQSQRQFRIAGQFLIAALDDTLVSLVFPYVSFLLMQSAFDLLSGTTLPEGRTVSGWRHLSDTQLLS
jgi:hypothetical protein